MLLCAFLMSGAQQNCPLHKRRFQVKSHTGFCDLDVTLVQALELREWLATSTDRPGRRAAAPDFGRSLSSHRPFLHGGVVLRGGGLLQAQQLAHERLISLGLLSCSL